MSKIFQDRYTLYWKQEDVTELVEFYCNLKTSDMQTFELMNKFLDSLYTLESYELQND